MTIREQGEDWTEAYRQSEDVHKRLRDEVEFTLEAALKDAEIKVHAIPVRVKTLPSFLEKIQRKDYPNPLDDMGDIVAGRVVCLFIEDIPKVEKLIRRTFDVIGYEDKAKAASPEIWHYASVHFDCKLRDAHKGPRYDPLKDRRFELQVRTILQDAWAAVDHHLAYKGEESIPNELKRDFSALAGLFHVADKTFQQINYASQNLDKQAEQLLQTLIEGRSQAVISGDTTDATIDRSTTKALLRELYPDRKSADDLIYSQFVTELTMAEITSILSLRDLLEEGRSKAEKSEEKTPPMDLSTKSRIRFNDVGFARRTLSLVTPNFARIRKSRRSQLE
ncbi:hypothetical protein [Mycobacteroides franklinii]|uniref:hypothetical protein n=1 Tax=Mycobacteroides franklinii TaxID=948102 RepID=UPI0013E8B718